MKNILKLLLAAGLIIGLFFLIAVAKILTDEPEISYGMHYGINQTTEFFDQAYKNISPERPQEKIAGITVNHHLLAPHLIAKEFTLVATETSITVVLLSPNHFYVGDGGAITSQYDWQTPYGVLKTNQGLVKQLSDSGLVNIDETPFEQEHGINGIVGFIKKSLPNANFVSLIVKDNLSDTKADQIAQKLVEILPYDSLIVGSLDYSHYLTSNGAQFHDIQTLSVMNNFDYDKIAKLDIDSHVGLRLLLKYFDLTGNKKFVVNSHENSSTVTGNYSFVETTSYINGFFTQGSNKHSDARTVLYVQGITSQDHWKVDASERLYKYTDQVVTEMPRELNTIFYSDQPTAVGLVYNPNLTDIYIFPLNVSNHLITLLPELKPDTMHIQIK